MLVVVFVVVFVVFATATATIGTVAPSPSSCAGELGRTPWQGRLGRARACLGKIVKLEGFEKWKVSEDCSKGFLVVG